MVKKERKKELSNPDKFQVTMTGLLDWAEKNVKAIALVVAPIFVLAIVAVVWQYMSQAQADTRVEELAKITEKYDAEKEAFDKRKQELQKRLNEVSAKIRAAEQAVAKANDNKEGDDGAEDNPVVKGLDEALVTERDAIQKQVDAMTPDHSGSLGEFRSFFDKYSGSPEGWRAGVQAAKILVDEDKFADSKTILTDVVKQSLQNEFFQIYGRLLLINVLEELGEFDQALTEVTTLEGLSGDDLKPKVLLMKGRIQLAKQAKTEAKTTLDTLIEKHGTSPEAQKARSLQALLN